MRRIEFKRLLEEDPLALSMGLKESYEKNPSLFYSRFERTKESAKEGIEHLPWVLGGGGIGGLLGLLVGLGAAQRSPIGKHIFYNSPDLWPEYALPIVIGVTTLSAILGAYAGHLYHED